MMSRIAILDVYNGFNDRKAPPADVIEAFRVGVGSNGLKYAAGYYPWVETNIVQETEVKFTSLTDESLTVLQQILMEEQGLFADKPPADGTKAKQVFDLLNSLPGYKTGTASVDDINKSLVFLSIAFNKLLKEIQNRLNQLPPASAMAGIYTMVDNTRGVWKAPANVSLNAVVRPLVNITHEDQEDLNVSLTGKSINAIRSFIGEGVLVWGARTLDGNSQDWKYINVRRTMIMLEQSVKAASKAYVFEPNDAGTWSTVKSMIENFLYSQWKSGALAGSVPADAYSVHVGLGDTMTADDILDGIMRITFLVAISRPAEFIEITFQQQMQKS
jgi:phage tail sheath protein FI